MPWWVVGEEVRLFSEGVVVRFVLAVGSVVKIGRGTLRISEGEEGWLYLWSGKAVKE
jgi:hypothetical protein